MAASGKVEENYRDVAPDLEFHLWPDVSHLIMMDKPAEFNRAVKAFVVKDKSL